ncbi:SIR2 family protein [Escherichia coli]|uniref:SIR2 family protein n=1 Tax=Escherichia coli TaxID=562 RepID=UPI000BE60F6A|nr:SIR2 family protein [Escherichia coli]
MTNNELKEILVNIFRQRSAGPFLFVGSGFSRRYIGLPDWAALLSVFCTVKKPFEYYLSSGDGTYPTAARLIAEDFNNEWWTDDLYSSSRDKFSKKVTDKTSAMRFEICDILTKAIQKPFNESQYLQEINLLSNLNVDGLITTNWDCFLEQLFPDYKVYTGQNELLFSNPQSIAEIYKIHGSAHKPKSLVLTDYDYADFNLKNPYLAAKLITIFVEHPVVFLGYSLSDKNISDLLSAISVCIGSENLHQLRNNLIFVQREEGIDEPTVSDTYTAIDGVQIPITLIRTDDFLPIYEAIDENKRKIPARILRYCKEELYNLVQSNEPEKKIYVVDIDEVEKHEDVEFVVGVGVAAAKKKEDEVGMIGYTQIKNLDLFEDLLRDNKHYNASSIIENVIPNAGKHSPNIPIFKYLREIGITNLDEYKSSSLKLDKWVLRFDKNYQCSNYFRSYVRKFKGKDAKYIIEHCTPESASIYLPFLWDKLDHDVTYEFLLGNIEKINPDNSSYATYFKKLACLYDRLKYGWL